MEPANVVIVGEVVIVPLKSKVPASVKLNWQPVVPVAVAPLIVTEPVEIEIMLFLVVVVADIVREPAVSEPCPTAIVQVAPFEGLGIKTKPVTAKLFVPEIVNKLLEVVAANVSVLHAALATFTVTVIPLLIVTASADVGIACPPHVAGASQLPETEAVRAAAFALLTVKNNNTKIPTINNSVGFSFAYLLADGFIFMIL